MSSATTPPSVDTYAATITINGTGQFLTLGSHASPRLPFMPAGRRIVGWSISTRPTDANGSIFVATDASGPLTPTEMAAKLAQGGTAIRLDPGEVLQTPANVAGPYNLNLAVTAVGAATTVRLVVHMAVEP